MTKDFDSEIKQTWNSYCTHILIEYEMATIPYDGGLPAICIKYQHGKECCLVISSGDSPIKAVENSAKKANVKEQFLEDGYVAILKENESIDFCLRRLETVRRGI